MNFKGRDILIVGFGVSGQAAARFLMHRGAKVTVTDSRNVEAQRIPPDLRRLSFHQGHETKLFLGRDLIVVSPGVPLDLPALKAVRRKGIAVVGEFGLAAKFLKAPLIAVTGTNGKSTTVTLIHEMIKAAGLKSALGGNIGTPLMEIVEEKKKFDWVVAEVSSYQLETVMAPFRPKISAILNVTEDHLDRYPSIREYAQAKFRIFQDQKSRDVLVYNGSDPIVAKGVRRAKAKKIDFSVTASLRVTPTLEGMKLVGLHNLENMSAAIAVASSAGVPLKAIQKVMASFSGLPHRTQFVREVEGVRYFDDSKGTNVDAVVKSLAGFPDGRVVLIAGGRDKGGRYDPLRTACRKKAKLVILIGEARAKIAEALEGSVPVRETETLGQAVGLAHENAVAGDTVLLSPACSSFDQFRDYKERGDVFQKLVRDL